MSRAEIAISASGRRAFCALRLPDGHVVRAPDESSNRGTDLAPAVAALCAAHAVAPQDLGGIRVDVGPGSYTGLRVAITFARTTAAFTGAHLEQFTSVELLALATWARGEVAADRQIAVVLDARRERFHIARLRLDHGVVQLVSGPAAVDLPTLAAALQDQPVVVADAALHETLAAEVSSLQAPTEVVAEDLFAPALVPRAVAVDAIEPLYLMATYAD